LVLVAAPTWVFTRRFAYRAVRNELRGRELIERCLNSPTILFANHASPSRQALGGMLLHPLRESRGAHQAGLH
jgi:hypothetical protein